MALAAEAEAAEAEALRQSRRGPVPVPPGEREVALKIPPSTPETVPESGIREDAVEDYGRL